MDKSAIQQIQELGQAPEFLKQLEPTNFPVAALPAAYELHDLESYMQNRNMFRGTLSTANIDEFVRYHDDYQLEGNQCFVNPDDMSALTIFDLGTQVHPGHCQHKAKLSLKKTAAFKELLHRHELKQNQKQLAEFIEDYSDFIRVFSTYGDLINNPVASAAVRNMKFEAKAGRESSVSDFSQHQSEYESIAVKTKDEFPMPAVFKFTCEPYLGLTERVFEMRMSTIGNETLILRIKKLEQHEEEMGEEFQNILAKSFVDENIEIDTYIGSFNC
jgi:uncharacterized protein YfdQ (DUF2303 family)